MFTVAQSMYCAQSTKRFRQNVEDETMRALSSVLEMNRVCNTASADPTDRHCDKKKYNSERFLY